MPRLWTSERDYLELAAPSRPSTLDTEIATRSDAYGAMFSSFYNAVANPDPVLRKSGNTVSILAEIRRDAHVSSCSRSRKAGVLKRKWMLDAGEATPDSVQLLETLFKQMRLRRIMAEMLDAWGLGYQVSEVIWERAGNYLLPSRVVGKPSEWFNFSPSNELQRISKDSPNGAPVEPYKFLLTTCDASYLNPYGEAQFSLCFWPVTFKKGGLKFWAKFLERWGMPHPIGKMPRGATSDDRAKLLRALAQLVQDAVATIPDDSSVELLEMAGGGATDCYERFVKYHDAEISKVLLGHSAAADSTAGKLGNENLAEGVRADLIDNDCRMVEETVDTLIRWTYELNPTLGAQRPSFVIYEEEEVDQALATRDKTLADTGQVRFTKEYFVKAYDFDEGDIEVVNPRGNEGAIGRQGDAAIPQGEPDGSAQLAAPEPPGEKPQAVQEIDGLIETGVRAVSTKPLLDPVEAALASSNTLEEFRDKLIDAYKDMDARELGVALAQGFTAAELAGRFELRRDVGTA